MRAGQLRHRLEIQRNTPITDTFGERTDNWLAEAVRWGRLTPVSAREFFADKQVTADVTHEGTMRWYPLTAQHRIKFDGRYFNVQTVMDDEGRKIQMKFLAKDTLEAPQ